MYILYPDVQILIRATHGIWARKMRSFPRARPTPIQRFAIPVALAGYDAMCCAQTGSGGAIAGRTRPMDGECRVIYQ